jgi:hypothetical protein
LFLTEGERLVDHGKEEVGVLGIHLGLVGSSHAAASIDFEENEIPKGDMRDFASRDVADSLSGGWQIGRLEMESPSQHQLHRCNSPPRLREKRK